MYTFMILSLVSDAAFLAAIAVGTTFFNKQGCTKPRTKRNRST